MNMEIKYEIEKKIGVLSQKDSGWEKIKYS